MLSKIILILALLPTWALAQTEEIFTLSTEINGNYLGSAVTSYLDKDKSTTAKEILALSPPFLPSYSAFVNYGISPGSVWLKMRLKNPTSVTQTVYIEFDQGPSELVELYADDGTLLGRAGERVDFREWPIAYRRPVFPLEIAPGTHMFLMRADLTVKAIPLKIWTPREFYSGLVKSYGLSFMLFGFVSLMLIYNLLTYFLNQKLIYLRLCFFVLMCLVEQFGQKGLAKQMFPELWLTQFYFTQMSLMIASSTFFASSFMAIARIAPTLWQALRWVFPIYLSLSLMIFVGEWIRADWVPFLVAGSIGVCIPASVAMISVSMWQRKDAGFYLTVAALPILILGVMTGLMQGGVLPAHAAVDYFIMLGESFMVLILAVTVAEKLKSERNQALKEQTKLQMSIDQAKLTHESALRLEAEARSRLAAGIAHQLNNPLNYIMLATQQIAQDRKLLERSLTQLLGPQPSEDGEIRAIQEYYSRVFDRMDSALLETQEGIRLAADTVAEIRILSGVDGISVDPVSLRDLLQDTIERLKPHLDPATLERLFIPELPASYMLLGNKHFIKNILSIYIEFLLRHSQGEVKLFFRGDGDRQNCLFHFEGDMTIQEEEYRALEQNLQSLGRNSKADLRLEYTSRSAGLYYSVSTHFQLEMVRQAS